MRTGADGCVAGCLMQVLCGVQDGRQGQEAEFKPRCSEECLAVVNTQQHAQQDSRFEEHKSQRDGEMDE